MTIASIAATADRSRIDLIDSRDNLCDMMQSGSL